jgi:hypothetical protein
VTLDEMYTEIELYGFDDLEDSQKLTLLNEAYFDIVTREPWPFLEAVTQIVVPSGQSQVTNNILVIPNPTDVNSVLSFTDITNEFALTPERGDVMEKDYITGNYTGTPVKYYFIGDNLMLYPSSTGSTYRLYYTKVPVAAVTASTEFFIPARHHSIIVYGALVKAFLVNDDPQAAVFQNMFEARYQQMRADVWMNQYDRTDYIGVVTDSYDWSY